MSSPESRSNSPFHQGDLRGRSPQVHERVAGPPAVSVTPAFWAESAGNTPSIFLLPTLLFLNVFLLPGNPTSSGASELSPPTPGPRFTIPSPSHFQGARLSFRRKKEPWLLCVIFLLLCFHFLYDLKTFFSNYFAIRYYMPVAHPKVYLKGRDHRQTPVC